VVTALPPPPLLACGDLLCTLVSCLGWRPSITARGHLPVALNEDGPHHLLARVMPGDDVKELHRHLLLVTVELMH
jgi:hypothetical protein